MRIWRKKAKPKSFNECIETQPSYDLSRLREFQGYIEEMGDKGLIEFWAEIENSIRKPVREHRKNYWGQQDRQLD